MFNSDDELLRAIVEAVQSHDVASAALIMAKLHMSDDDLDLELLADLFVAAQYCCDRHKGQALETLIRLAIPDGKPVVIDFTEYRCLQ